MDLIELFFDIETKTFFDETGNSDPAQLGASIVSVYHRRLGPDLLEIAGEMRSFWDSELHDMWHLFRSAHRVIGFNTINFDIPVLKPIAPADFAKLPHFDIYQKIRDLNEGRAASLNRIAKDTLGIGKVDDPANAIMYWKKHDPESLALLKKYCEADVALTRDIYDYGRKHGHLKFTDKWNTPRQVPVDFSYPPDLIATAQPSLF